VLSSIVDRKSLLAEITVTGSKTMDSDTNESGRIQYFFLRQMCYAMNKW